MTAEYWQGYRAGGDAARNLWRKIVIAAFISGLVLGGSAALFLVFGRA